MQRTLSIVVLLLVCSLPLLAGEYLMNDTGQTAYGLRVTFSEPVTITGYGDVLVAVEPAGESRIFTFSGAAVEAWGGQWLNWEPETAELVSTEWLASGWDLSVDATATDFDYEIEPEGIDTSITISRHIDRNCLPFSVEYAVGNPHELDDYTIAWDTDKYVDADGNGDPQDDREFEGPTLEFVYLENYNPTITLLLFNDRNDLVAQWENMARNDFLVGKAISLNRHVGTVADVDAIQDARWSQVHMEKMDLEYVSEYKSMVTDAGLGTSEAIHQSPGRYVYELRTNVEDGSLVVTQVSAWVVERRVYDKRAGLLMADLWNEEYDEATDSMLDVSGFFSNADATDKLDWLVQQGLDEIVVMNIHPMVDIAPLPEIVEVGPMHKIGPDDVAMVFSHIPVGHISWLTFSFVGMDGEASIDPWYWADVENRDLEYYQEFFRQYVPMVLEEARQAEELGLSSISLGWGHPYLRYLPRIRALDWSTGEWVANQWINLIREVKAVFSGQVGVGFIWADDAEEGVVAEADFVAMSLQNYKDAERFLGDAGSIEELRTQYEEYISYLVNPTFERFQKPIRYTFWANSFEDAATAWRSFENYVYGTWRKEFALGGHSEEILSGQATPQLVPDFREQVRMVEAIMPALASNPHIFFIVPQFEYWKLLDFDDFAPRNVIDYFNVVTGSMQGKPAFQAFRLWASMLDPNERLAYRHVVPVELSSLLTSGRDVPPTEIDWSSIPFILEYANDFEPATFWRSGSSYPISESQHWDSLPGHQIRLIGLQLDCDGLQIHWESYDEGLRGGFEYWARFGHPLSSHSTMFVIVNPLDGVVGFVHSSQAGWNRLPASGVSYTVSDNRISVRIPADAFPEGFSVDDVAMSTVGLDVVYRNPPSDEFYCYLSGTRYVDVAQYPPDCP
jgi:hypothetical protein